MNTSRRHFLRLSSTAVAAATLPRRGYASSGESRVRPIGFSLYGMQTLPVAEAIRHCGRIGYASVELCLLKDFPTEIGKFPPPVQSEVRNRLLDSGMELASLLVNIDLSAADQTSALDTIKSAAEIARRLQDRPPLIQSVPGGTPALWETDKERIAANARGLAEVAAAAGVKLAIKAHCTQAVRTPEQLLWLYRRVNHEGFILAYDYSHYQVEGLALEPTLRTLIPHTGFIHLKDAVVGTRPAQYLLPGEGETDYVRYFKLLSELKYSGPVVIEISSQTHRRPGYDPVATAEKCHALLSKALRGG